MPTKHSWGDEILTYVTSSRERISWSLGYFCLQPSMRYHLQRGLQTAKFSRCSIRLLRKSTDPCSPTSSTRHQGDIFSPNRVTIVGSSLFPSSVGGERGWTAVGDVFGKITKAVQRSCSADAQWRLGRDYTI